MPRPMAPHGQRTVGCRPVTSIPAASLPERTPPNFRKPKSTEPTLLPPPPPPPSRSIRPFRSKPTPSSSACHPPLASGAAGMASQISKRARFGPLSASEVDPSAASSSAASHPSSPPPSDSNSLSASRNSRSNETTWGGDLMPTGESAQMAAAGGVRMPTVGVDQKPTREIDQMSVVGGSQPQGDSAAHDELQERCFACDGDHSLLHCDVKFSMCQASGMYGMSTEKPFHYVDCPKEIRDIIQDPLAKPMIRAWFKVFNVPDADVTRSWRELFHCASQVGLLVDVDIGTLDGNRSDCIRMLIDLVSTNGAPFVATVSYGPCYRKVRFELEEVSQGEVKGCREAS